MTAQLLVVFVLLLVTINSSCISLTKAVKEKPPLIIEMNTDEYLGKFTDYGISKNMVSFVYSYLDIVSVFTLSITNRSFYCLFNHQLDWVKFHYYLTTYCKMNSGGKKSDHQLLRKILSLSLTQQDNIYFSQIPTNFQDYLSHIDITSELKFDWKHSTLSFTLEKSESIPCPFGDKKSQCSVTNLFTEEFYLCTKILKNRFDFAGHHKHFTIRNFKLPFLYVFEHVNNSHDKLIFFFQNCSFDTFSKTHSLEIIAKKRKDTVYFYMTNSEGDKCFICFEFTKPLNTQCHVIEIVSKKNPKQKYKLNNLFYLPSISFFKD